MNFAQKRFCLLLTCVLYLVFFENTSQGVTDRNHYGVTPRKSSANIQSSSNTEDNKNPIQPKRNLLGSYRA